MPQANIRDIIIDRRAYYEQLANSTGGERFKIVVEEYDCLLRVINAEQRKAEGSEATVSQ